MCCEDFNAIRFSLWLPFTETLRERLCVLFGGLELTAVLLTSTLRLPGPIQVLEPLDRNSEASGAGINGT